jgi:hypothetical protein
MRRMKSFVTASVLLFLAAGCTDRKAETEPSSAPTEKDLDAALASWSGLRREAEGLIAILDSRIGELERNSPKLKRLSPETMSEARARIESMRANLTEATAAFDSGQGDLAVKKVELVKREGAVAFELLGLPLPARAAIPDPAQR